MAKESGLGFSVTVASEDISNDVTSLDVATPREALTVTGVNSFAMERIFGVADASGTLNTAFNDAQDMGFEMLSDVGTAAGPKTLVLAISSQSLTLSVLFTDYALARADNGALTASSPFSLADGTAPAWA